MKINLNDYVWVKLTEHGKKIHKERYDELVRMTGGLWKYEYEPVKEDEDGWSRWQFWCLMEAFGAHVSMGLEAPFETTLRVYPKGATQ